MMTHTELDQRARARAADEHLHTWRLNDGLYLVKSRKLAPGSHHLVAVDLHTGEIEHCSECPGWEYRRSCTHAQAVERRLEREGRKSRQTRPSHPGVVDCTSRRGQLLRSEA